MNWAQPLRGWGTSPAPKLPIRSNPLQSDYNSEDNYIKTGNFTWCHLLGWGLILTSQTIGILIMRKSSEQIGF